MCAVIGAVLLKPTRNELQKLQLVIRESRIRGMHATGLSYAKNGLVHTIKESIPADEFIVKHMLDMDQLINDDGNLFMVAHCRYSTSDLEYNQPIATETVSVVHNGVITQELPENWKALYGYECETKNDTELLLRTILEGKSPLEVWKTSSLAAVELYGNNRMRFYRNGKRPLYLNSLKNGSIITSTKDIAKRAGLENPTEVTFSAYVTLDDKGVTTFEQVPSNEKDLQEIYYV